MLVELVHEFVQRDALVGIAPFLQSLVFIDPALNIGDAGAQSPDRFADVVEFAGHMVRYGVSVSAGSAIGAAAAAQGGQIAAIPAGAIFTPIMASD